MVVYCNLLCGQRVYSTARLPFRLKAVANSMLDRSSITGGHNRAHERREDWIFCVLGAGGERKGGNARCVSSSQSVGTRDKGGVGETKRRPERPSYLHSTAKLLYLAAACVVSPVSTHFPPSDFWDSDTRMISLNSCGSCGCFLFSCKQKPRSREAAAY
jgi:hypothetical protein